MLQGLFTYLKRILSKRQSTHLSKSSATTPSMSVSAKTQAPHTATRYFASKELIPDGYWRWPDFTPEEVSSNGNGAILVHHLTIDKMQALRNRLGKPLIVTSWYRDRDYNREIGGVADSMHIKGQAVDISLRGHDKWQLYAAAKEVGFTGFGFYDSFLHVDTGKKRSWGSWS